jgi:hypothetical protein
MLPDLLDEIRVPRLGPGRPRTTPDKVLGDKAYSSRATRILLRGRGIVAVIPAPRDQRANRQRRGARGGRPVSYDHDTYKDRNVVERSFVQAMARTGHPLRQARHRLPRRSRPRRRHHLATTHRDTL